MNDIQIIQATLVLFWAGYIGLNWWLLRSPVNDGTESTSAARAAVIGKLQGEADA